MTESEMAQHIHDLVAENERLTAVLPCGHNKAVNDDSYGGCATCALHQADKEADAEIATLRARIAELEGAKVDLDCTVRLGDEALAACQAEGAGRIRHLEAALAAAQQDVQPLRRVSEKPEVRVEGVWMVERTVWSLLTRKKDTLDAYVYEQVFATEAQAEAHRTRSDQWIARVDVWTFVPKAEPK